MIKETVGVMASGSLKVLVALVMTAISGIAVTQEKAGQVDNTTKVDIPSLVGKNIEGIIKQIGKPKFCLEFERKDIVPRVASITPPYDDSCQYRFGRDFFFVFTYRGRFIGALYTFGDPRKRSVEPEEALRRVGINVNQTKPDRVIQNPPERPFLNRPQSPYLISSDQDVIWSGTFNGINWKEVRVVQNVKGKHQCPTIIAIVSDNVQ
jgi:hypothetical protein